MKTDEKPACSSCENPNNRYFVVHVRFGDAGTPVRVPTICPCGAPACSGSKDLAEFLRQIGLTVIEVVDHGHASPEADLALEGDEKTFAVFLHRAYGWQRGAERIAQAVSRAVGGRENDRVH